MTDIIGSVVDTNEGRGRVVGIKMGVLAIDLDEGGTVAYKIADVRFPDPTKRPERPLGGFSGYCSGCGRPVETVWGIAYCGDCSNHPHPGGFAL